MLFYYCLALLFIASCNGHRFNKPKVDRNPICTKRNGYHKIGLSCDTYIECTDYIAKNKSCPDGFNFNDKASWPNYPCGYPMDVPCDGSPTQKPKPTNTCPHQYGFFPSPNTTSTNCGQYRQCIAGKAYEMFCPTGLAFNPDTSRCDWADLVPSCNLDEFLGFKCPRPPRDYFGKLMDITLNYKYDGNCYYFFSCEKGRARLLSCDVGMAFDPDRRRCVDEELVQCDDDNDDAQ